MWMLYLVMKQTGVYAVLCAGRCAGWRQWWQPVPAGCVLPTSWTEATKQPVHSVKVINGAVTKHQRCCHQACMSRPRVRTCLRFGNSKSPLTPLCCLSFVCSPFFWVLSFFCSRSGTFPPYFIGWSAAKHHLALFWINVQLCKKFLNRIHKK